MKPDTVGTIKTTKKIDCEFVKLFHKVFYQPQNQIIVLFGNFDIEKIKQLIIQTYDELNMKKIYYNPILDDEPKEVKESKRVIISSKEALVNMTFKVDTSLLKPFERIKLAYYINYFLKYNFSESSSLYAYLVDKKYTVYSIDNSGSFLNDLLIINFICYTKEPRVFEYEVLNIVKEIPFDLDSFKIWKNKELIDIILDNNYVDNMINSYLENILTFKYNGLEDISDIEKFTIEKYLEIMKKLDFSHYSTIVRASCK